MQINEADISITKKAHSILPNSSPEVLAVKKGLNGNFQVKWIEQIDAHVLFFKRNEDGAVFTLASHHNGYSCDALTKRIIMGDIKQVEEQLDCIARCGGMVCDKSYFKTVK